VRATLDLWDRTLLGLPQVARALLFAQIPSPAVLLAPAERVALYGTLDVLGRRAAVNPGLEAWGEEFHVVLSFEEALAPFPEDPSAWRLVLEVGRSYGRDELLERLARLGYPREELEVRGDQIRLQDLKLEFFGDVLESMEEGGRPLRRWVLLPRAGKSEVWTGKKIDHFPGPVFIERPAQVPPELWSALEGRPFVLLGSGGPERPMVELEGKALPPYRARLSRFLEDLNGWLHEGRRIVLFYKHARSRDYLLEKLKGLPLRQGLRLEPQPGEIQLLPAPFEGGYLEGETVYLTEAHLYAFGSREAPRMRIYGGLEDPGALFPGDYLIHPEHGIGQYLGLESREVLGVRRDYLILRYAGEGRLYLPVEQLPLLRRHPGTTDDPPALSSLGKGEWRRACERAQKSAEELAQRLLLVHARRQASQGRSFPPIEGWEERIAESFPYTLTPDQERALEEVLRDLEAPYPMDRLLSGDVGFGKTEIALRAAHRVVGHGAQVAMLVPTTLLADQHTRTFRERFAALPVRVEGLSRFTPEREVQQILEGLKAGTIDIVIGTHRLLSEDVRFHDLGLLIIDEEHRFGVAQKERIRELAQGVDTLSMSATPIPRTLYSALVGIRDLSSIQSPPPGRKPIRTVLSVYDPALVREAVLSEIERGGKVFYVYDRIASILLRKAFLETLIPEARIGVVHGQMGDREIEETMLAFAEGAFDLLLSTTIIESGLDIPEANTLIVERSDRLGLAALYQLRGRVGRRDREAWAYLFHPPRLTEAAERRLQAIADLSDLGSGHLLAERDMEIRGVGNLLGPEQHGHIQAVSLEVYSELLAEAIRKLKGEEAPPPPRRVVLDLALSARLPPEYIPNPVARGRYYGQLAEVKGLAQLSRLSRELTERYGPLPQEAQSFLALTRLRLLAESKGVVSITEDLTHLLVAFERWPIAYDPKILRTIPVRVELSRHPPGFLVDKRGLAPERYPELLTELLWAVD